MTSAAVWFASHWLLGSLVVGVGLLAMVGLWVVIFVAARVVRRIARAHRVATWGDFDASADRERASLGRRDRGP